MSGETEGAPFGWTLDSLKVHLDARILHEEMARAAGHEAIGQLLVERDRRYEQRWISQEDAVRLALVNVNKEMIERMRQVREESVAAMASSDKAISKAELATEKRFETMNGLREQLSSQAAQFAQRREVDAIASGLSEKVFALTARLDSCATRDEVLQHADAGSAALDGFRAQTLARWDAGTPRISAMSDDIVALKASYSRLGALEEMVRAQKERLDKTEGQGQGSQAMWGYLVGAVGLILTIVTLANVLTSTR